MSKVVIGYWDIRGLAEPCRLMLEYAGVEYEDKRYTCGDAPTFDRSCWLDVKLKLGFDFPNLPYFIDGDIKLTESWAILKYIARKNNLLPSESNRYLCDMLEGVVSDFRGSFVSLCYGSNFEKKSESFFDSLPEKLDKFETYLSKNNWLGGENLTYVDFPFCEILNQMKMMKSGILDKYEHIRKYLDNFENLDKIKAYKVSERFKEYTVNNKMAKWGNGQ